MPSDLPLLTRTCGAPSPKIAVRERVTLALVAAGLRLSACTGDATSLPPTPPAGDTAVVTNPLAGTGNALAGAVLWVNPSSAARATADAWRITRAADAALMDEVALGATAQWVGAWMTDVRADVDAATTKITNAGALPVFVSYNIPQRDCGALPAGSPASAYRDWIAAFASGIGTRRAAVILEPDALAGMECLSSAVQQLRLDLLKFAVQTFASRSNIVVYLDAGHPGWKSAAVMASRLTSAGVAATQGFALNVSNFQLTSDNVSYGTQLSSLVGGKALHHRHQPKRPRAGRRR